MLDYKLQKKLVTGFDKFQKKYKKEFSASGTQKLSTYRSDKRIAKGFNFEWKLHSKITAEHKIELQHVYGNLISFNDFNNKIVLDAGCGQGRFAYFNNKYGKAKEVYCIDMGEQVLLAKKNLKEYDNVHIIQASIHNLPFKKNFFDIIYSIGVLHHLPEPIKGYQSLIKHLKPNGKIFVWIYGHSMISPIINLIKKISLKFPEPVVYLFSLFPSLLMWPIIIAHKIGKNIKPVKYLTDLLPFGFYTDRTFPNLWNINFDKMNSSIAFFSKKKDVKKWNDRNKLKNFRVSERYPGQLACSWRLYAEKK